MAAEIRLEDAPAPYLVIQRGISVLKQPASKIGVSGLDVSTNSNSYKLIANIGNKVVLGAAANIIEVGVQGPVGPPGNPADYLQFDVTDAGPSTEGEMRWNTDKGLPEVQLAHNFDLEIGQQLVSRVVNKTGSTITKGKIVYINGGQGNRPTVALASNDAEGTSSKTFAVLAQDIANNGNGWVIVVGTLYNFNTASYTAGQVLYLGTSGNFTATKPVAPAHMVTVAKVVNVHAVEGVIEINIQNGFELDELHNVKIVNPTNGQVLKYNSTSQLWENGEAAGADTLQDVTDRGATTDNQIIEAVGKTLAYTSGKLTSVTGSDGVVKTLTYNGDGTLNQVIATMPDTSVITKTMVYSGGVLTGVNVT